MPPDPVQQRMAQMKTQWAAMAQRQAAEQQRKREELRQRWDGFNVDDRVLLDATASRQVFDLRTAQGEQIRVDGLIREIRERDALVWVNFEVARGCMGMIVPVKPEQITHVDEIHVWLRGRERQTDRERRGVGSSGKYWE